MWHSWAASGRGTSVCGRPLNEALEGIEQIVAKEPIGAPASAREAATEMLAQAEAAWSRRPSQVIVSMLLTFLAISVVGAIAFVIAICGFEV